VRINVLFRIPVTIGKLVPVGALPVCISRLHCPVWVLNKASVTCRFALPGAVEMIVNSQSKIDARFLARTTEELYATTPTGFLLIFVGVPFILVLTWGRLPATPVLYWGALGAAVFAIRMGLFWWFHARRASHSDFFWRSWFQAGFFLSGLVWVVLPWMLMDQTDLQTASLLSGLLAVVPLVSVFGVLFDFPTSMIQPLMIYPAMAIWWIEHGGRDDNIGWVSLLFCPLLYGLARRANKIAASNIRQGIALQEARDAAEASNHSKSEFLANMSHELRTPLNAVIGFSQIIAEEHFGPVHPARYKEYAEDILDSGYHLLSLINDILDISKLEAGRLRLDETTAHPGDLVESVVHMMGAVARKSAIEIEVQIADSFPQMRMDDRAVRQILINLLSNAIKFSPTQSKVRVRAAYSAQGGLSIEVQDSGPGMHADAVIKAFEPFSQLSAAGDNRNIQGTGLGLAISKSLAELHNGSLKLETAPGAGVKAVLILPASRFIQVKT